MSGLSFEEIWTSCGLALTAATCGLGHGVLGLGFVTGVVLAEQVLEHLAAGGGADGVADTVVLVKGLDLAEVVIQVKVLPALGIADRDVEGHVQPPQFEQGLESRGGCGDVLLRNPGDPLRREDGGVEEVVDLAQAGRRVRPPCLFSVSIMLAHLKKGPWASSRYPRAVKRLATSRRKRCKSALPNRARCCCAAAARRRPLATIGSRST